MAHIARPAVRSARLLAWSAALCTLLAALPARAVFGDEDLTPREPGTVGAIIITGNTHSDPRLVEHVMGLAVGDAFDPETLDRAWDALEDSGYFRFVEIGYDDSDPSHVVLEIMVEEDLHTFYGPLLRYDRRHKYLAGGWLEQRNLRGRGETLRVEAAPLYARRGHVSWQRPWFLGITGLETSLGWTGEAAEFVFRPFRYRKWDAAWTTRYRFGDGFYAATELGYGAFTVRDAYSWALPARGSGAPAGRADFATGTENHWACGGRLGFDSRTNPYYPASGFLAELGARAHTSNGFADFTETWADLRAFVPLPWRQHVLAARAWGRRVDGPTNLDNALFFGGPTTVRGQPFASREGEEGYLLSVEYRLPLFLMQISPKGEMVGFGFHLFGDAGDTWFEGADPGVAMMSYGAGAHLNLDTWQLRFEAARTDDGEWRFEFMDKFNF